MRKEEIMFPTFVFFFSYFLRNFEFNANLGETIQNVFEMVIFDGISRE